MLLWLWCRQAAAAPIGPTSLGTSICRDFGTKKPKKKKKTKQTNQKKKKKNGGGTRHRPDFTVFQCNTSLGQLQFGLPGLDNLQENLVPRQLVLCPTISRIRGQQPLGRLQCPSRLDGHDPKASKRHIVLGPLCTRLDWERCRFRPLVSFCSLSFSSF